MAHFPENFPWGAASERSEDIETARKKMFSRPEGFGGFSHHDLLDPLCLEDNPGKPDFIGLNIYNGTAVRAGEKGPKNVPYPVGGPRTAICWPWPAPPIRRRRLTARW